MGNLVEDINKVYQMLEDELSKQVFEARLAWNEYREIDKLIKCLEKPDFSLKNKKDFNIINAEYKDGETVVVYGAGACGVVEHRAMKQRYPQCNYIFCDRNYKKLKEEGTLEADIISPEELLLKYKDCKVLVTPTEGNNFKEIIGFLEENNVENIITDAPHVTGAYFTDFMPLTSEEVFVDGGSFFGATSIEFAKHCNNQYKKIHLFEPNIPFKESIERTVASLENVQLHMKGLWNEETSLHFSENGSASKIRGDGEITVEVTSLDIALQGEEATFIKMDIEGAELNALRGAKETIQKYKPKLAICIYHKREDILEIPLYIKELVPEYKIYMRHHSSWPRDTVLYALVED